jgi:hypothetical protein
MSGLMSSYCSLATRCNNYHIESAKYIRCTMQKRERELVHDTTAKFTLTRTGEMFKRITKSPCVHINICLT